MTAPKNFKWTFRDVLVYSTEITYVVAGHDSSTKQELPGCALLRWAGNWSAQPFALNGTGVAVTRSPEINVLIMGVDGRVLRWGKTFAEETVDLSEDGPQNYGDLREIRTIGTHAYVVGMRRTAYRCERPARWIRIDQDVRCSDDDESDAGFNSIDGFNESEIYAVGWEGQIWTFNGQKWREIQSPTNLALFRVICAEDGLVYACGQKGIVIVGRRDDWRVIEPSATEESFWGSTYFQSRPYFCTTDALFAIEKEGFIPITVRTRSGREIRPISKPSFYRLSSNAEILWSVGAKMAIYTSDAEIWTETPYF